jgi:hypothetical protein
VSRWPEGTLPAGSHQPAGCGRANPVAPGIGAPQDQEVLKPAGGLPQGLYAGELTRAHVAPRVPRRRLNRPCVTVWT